MLYAERKLWRQQSKDQFVGYFYYESAVSLFDGILPGSEKLIDNMWECFVFSKMTNIKDRRDRQRYHSLEPVEFLEFFCRVA